MVAKKSDEAAELRVLVQIAYAHLNSGEMKQLVKGDLVDPATVNPEALEHLKSIGFVG